MMSKLKELYRSGDRGIFCDEDQYMICDITIAGDNAKNAGEEKLINHKYYPTLPGCLKRFAETEAREVAKDLKTLVNAFCDGCTKLERLVTTPRNHNK